MNLKVINKTSSTFYFYVHPAKNVLMESDGSNTFDEFSTFARACLKPDSSLYAELKNVFYTAAMYQNPDTSMIVTDKLPLASGNSYTFNADNTLSAGNDSDNCIRFHNSSNQACTFLIYGNATCLLKKTVSPEFDSSITDLCKKLCNISISISNTQKNTDFFKVQENLDFSFSSDSFSFENVQYATFTLTEDAGTKKICFSAPDYTPFSPLNSNN